MGWGSCCSVAQSCQTFCDPHRLQHTRLPCPSLSPGVCSNSCLLSWWCYLNISSSAIHFSWTNWYLLSLWLEHTWIICVGVVGGSERFSRLKDSPLGKSFPPLTSAPLGSLIKVTSYSQPKKRVYCLSSHLIPLLTRVCPYCWNKWNKAL